MNKSNGWVALVLMLGLACATRVNIAPSHRDDVAAPAKVLELAAQNLEGAVRGRTGTPAQDRAADAVVKFHAASAGFARIAGRGDMEDMDIRYEKMIEAYVHLKDTFPDLQADSLMNDSYQRVQDEWEKLARVTGYAGKRYQKKVEGK